MTQLTEFRAESAPSPWKVESQSLVRWVCTSNPFYVLSALLVCLGLRMSFGSQVNANQTWALLSGMAGYTLLLAVTACLLVRFIGVWDDVRTVLLIVVLMFLATSVTFDEVLARDPTRGIICYFAGLLFAVAVSEGILWSTQLKLPAYFRVPYYLILTLFFLYPVALTPLLEQPQSEALSWALFGFSPAAGLIFLTLVPAIRRGRGYVRDNGSPWGWAWYPWTLFGLLGLAVMARSALLCWSMHHLGSAAAEPYIFGPYFLVPFVFALGVLLLEIGLVERQRGVLWLVLAVPPIVLVLALVGHRPEVVYQGFLTHFSARLGGSPLFLTVIASAGFYAYASLRRVPFAVEALCGALVALAFVAPGTIQPSWLTIPRAWPILVAAGLQFEVGLRKHSSWRILLSACGLVAAVIIELDWPGVAPYRAPIAFHLLLIAALVVGTAFDDLLGHLLRSLGAIAALMGCLIVLRGGPGDSGRFPAGVAAFYPLVLSALIAAYGYVFAQRTALWCASLGMACWLIASGRRAYSGLRNVVVGLDFISIGMALFALAVLTSAVKGGVLRFGTAAQKEDHLEPPA